MHGIYYVRVSVISVWSTVHTIDWFSQFLRHSLSSSWIQQICVPPDNIILCLSASGSNNSTVKHSKSSSTMSSGKSSISKHLSPVTLFSGVSVRGALIVVKSTPGVAVWGVVGCVDGVYVCVGG